MRVVLLLAVLSVPAAAQERVYVFADSLQWVLTQRTDSSGRPVSCEVATKAQPGARFALFPDEPPLFSVSLIGNAIALLPSKLEKVSLRIDDGVPINRNVTHIEMLTNQVRFWGPNESRRVLGVKRLKVRATYHIDGKSGAGGYQDHDIDLRGLTALYPLMNARCDPRMIPGPSLPAKPK